MPNDASLAAQVRESLPLEVTWGPILLLLVLAYLAPRFAGLLVGYRCARRSGRHILRGSAAHWTERARQRASSEYAAGHLRNVLAFNGAVVLVILAQGPLRPIPAVRLVPICVLIATSQWFTGYLRGQRRGNDVRWIHQPSERFLAHWNLLRGGAAIRVLCVMLLVMPLRFEPMAVLVFVAGCALLFWLHTDGLLRLSRLLGSVLPATPPLESLVRDLAVERGMPPPRTWIHRAPVTNALATYTRELVVTESLLYGLTASEVRAVLAHEFAHLQEPARTWRIRLLLSISPCLISLAYPIAGQFGIFYALSFALTIPLLYRVVPRWMRGYEQHADAGARTREDDPTHLGRALESIARIDLSPSSRA